MKNAKGKIEELFLDGSARIACPPELTPAPGQYLLAHASDSDSPLAVPLFSSMILSQIGFRSAPPVPSSWRPGDSLSLRGPIGHGFTIPPSARKVALVAVDDLPFRLRGLIVPALKQNAEIVLVCNSEAHDLPEVIEVQPLQALTDALHWADYAALDVSRENLDQLKERLAGKEQVMAKIEAQVLIRAPMPCGALADCGVCALSLHHDWKMICKDGPVFGLKELL
ncbi:MAG: dihydroorotate dehydrogenase electron transfer subunit [Anaerolineales bacterium]